MTNQQMDEAKKKSLELAYASIEKQFGKGTLVSRDKIPDMEFISAGSPDIDKVLGGGWARGRIVELYGPESSGKTTLTLHALAEAQKKGITCVFIDAEHAFDPVYAEKLGVNVDDLIFSQPDSGEQALNVAETLIASGAVGLVVIDSVAALVPQKELEGEMGDSNMGLHARLMSQAMRKLAGAASKTGTTIIFINQIRMKIGVMFGNPETVTGGNALKYYASQRVDIRRTGTFKDGTGEDAEAAGIKVKLKVVKNKIAKPFGEVEFSIRFGEGIDYYAGVLRAALSAGIIEDKSSRYKYNDKQIGHGEANAINELKTNPELLKEIVAKLAG